MVEAVRHARAVQGAIRQLQTMDDDELYVYAKVRGRPCDYLGVSAACLRIAAASGCLPDLMAGCACVYWHVPTAHL